MDEVASPDRRSIGRLLADYCTAVDGGDIETVVSLFTQGATVDYGPRSSATGQEALRELFARLRTVATATSHRVSNLSIDVVDADTVSAVCYVTAWHQLVGGEPRTLVIHGRYLDRLHRQGDGWRIDARRLEVHGSTAPVPFHRLDRSTTTPGP